MLKRSYIIIILIKISIGNFYYKNLEFSLEASQLITNQKR